MARLQFVIDTSALSRVSKRPIMAVLGPLAARGQLALTSPVRFELGYSARSHDDRQLLMERLAAFHQLDTVEADHQRALEVQEALTATSAHRGLSLVDALVAATAERVALSVLHYDHDFDRIAKVTRQPHDWVVPRGTAD
ncbi:MAG: PIN domain nuclease [Iamia sp.]